MVGKDEGEDEDEDVVEGRAGDLGDVDAEEGVLLFRSGRREEEGEEGEEEEEEGEEEEKSETAVSSARRTTTRPLTVPGTSLS